MREPSGALPGRILSMETSWLQQVLTARSLFGKNRELNKLLSGSESMTFLSTKPQ